MGVDGGDEDGIQGAGSGAPGDRDVVSGRFAEAVQFFGDNGIGGVGGGQGVGQGGFDVDVADQSGAGDLGDADGTETLRYQPFVQPAQALALGPRPVLCGG